MLTNRLLPKHFTEKAKIIALFFKHRPGIEAEVQRNESLKAV